MATAQMTLSVRDLLTPVLASVAAGMDGLVHLAGESVRRLEAFECELERLRWESAWADATGRPWGYDGRREALSGRYAHVDVTLDPMPYLTEVTVDGAVLPVSGAVVTTRLGERGQHQHMLALEVPLQTGRVAVRTRAPRPRR